MLRELEVLVSKETHYFRVISNLDNKAKDTLEKETENDDIVVSNNYVMAAPKSIFVQDKPVAVNNFPTSTIDAVDEINEVKAALLVKSLFPSLGAPKCPR